MIAIDDDPLAGTDACIACNQPFTPPPIHPAVAPAHCPACLKLERLDIADDLARIPRVHTVNGVGFERSAFVMGGAWRLAGTRLTEQWFRVADREGEQYIRRNWPYLTDLQIAAFREFVAPAPAGPAMRAEEV